jgi:hypothetical protein
MRRFPQTEGRVEAVIFFVCLVLSFVLLTLPNDVQVLVADRLGRVLTAPYWNLRNFISDIGDTKRETVRLAARVAELELGAAAAARAVTDRARSAGPAVPPGYEGQLIPCQVLVRQRGRYAAMIRIKSLTATEWYPYQAVMTAAGLIGRVGRVVDDQTAWVELLASPGMALGVEVERNGLIGVLRPRTGRFVLDLVGRDEDVRPGDRLITSGIAEIRDINTAERLPNPIPRGLPVGRVALVASPTDQIFKAIEAEPLASFEYNETVFVVPPPWAADQRR